MTGEVSDRRGAGGSLAYVDLRARPLALGDVERLQLALRGGSVIDWFRLDFDRREEVEEFARLLEFDLRDPLDLLYIENLRRDAARYLREAHRYRLPREVMDCDPVDLALYASQAKGRRRHRLFACILLKVMHIVHHINARELRFRLPVSDREVSDRIVAKVDACAARMRALGFPLVDYVGSQKKRDSLIAKLLVKRDNLAVEVYDRVRFRFVVAERDDLVPAILYLLDQVIPFNYVVPGQTQNDLVDLAALLRSHPLYRTYTPRLQVPIDLETASGTVDGPRNEFSGSTYRVVNFVADVPVRVPDAWSAGVGEIDKLGRVVFGLAEFQVIDVHTARQNERGENAHHRYKARQRARERERLERGLRR